MNKNDSPKEPIKRRWLSYGLRGLLALVLVCSIPLAWLAQRHARMRIEDDVVSKILEAKGVVIYAHHDDATHGGGFHVSTKNPAPGPQWMRDLLGENFFTSVSEVHFVYNDVEDDLIAQLPRLENLESVELYSALATDQCIDSLLQVAQLKELTLYTENLSGQALNRLHAHPELESLALIQYLASPENLKQVQPWPRLKHLTLQSSQATDEDMLHLFRSTNLQSLSIRQMSKFKLKDPRLAEELTSLEELSVYELRIEDQNISTIAQIRSLKKLSLGGTFISQDQLAGLSSLANLEVLDLVGTGVTRERLAVLKDMTSLKKVIIGRGQGIPAGKIGEVEIVLQ